MPVVSTRIVALLRPTPAQRKEVYKRIAVLWPQLATAFVALCGVMKRYAVVC